MLSTSKHTACIHDNRPQQEAPSRQNPHDWQHATVAGPSAEGCSNNICRWKALTCALFQIMSTSSEGSVLMPAEYLGISMHLHGLKQALYRNCKHYYLRGRLTL